MTTSTTITTGATAADARPSLVGRLTRLVVMWTIAVAISEELDDMRTGRKSR